MHVIIQSSVQTLNKCSYLLDRISDKVLCDNSIGPYYSTIGSHIRHILDFYDCIFKTANNNIIDLTDRSRNKEVETNCLIASNYLDIILNKLKTFDKNLEEGVVVIDDLGLGDLKIPYTFAALFSQANSHTIHHYAIINYILKGLNITFDEMRFGYNPTTPKEEKIG